MKNEKWQRERQDENISRIGESENEATARIIQNRGIQSTFNLPMFSNRTTPIYMYPVSLIQSFFHINTK